MMVFDPKELRLVQSSSCLYGNMVSLVHDGVRGSLAPVNVQSIFKVGSLKNLQSWQGHLKCEINCHPDVLNIVEFVSHSLMNVCVQVVKMRAV